MNMPLSGRRKADDAAAEMLAAALPPWVGRTALALLLALFIFLFTTAWTSKADKTDVDALRSDVQRVLDLLCTDRPTARQCSLASPGK